MDDGTPPYDSLFSITVDLCERFPGLTPLLIRQTKAREVFILIRRFTDYNERERKKEKQTKDGKRIIRRPAGDNWF